VATVIKKYSYAFVLSTYLISIGLDYVHEGRYSLVYLFPALVAGATLPPSRTMVVAALIGVSSIVFLPESSYAAFKPILLSRVLGLMFASTLTNQIVKRLNSKKNRLIRELTAHRDLNKTLKALILNDSNNALEVIDQSGKILNWNDKAHELTGIDNPIGQLHSEIFTEEFDTGQNKILETLWTGKEFLDQEITWIPPNQEPVIALVNTYILRNEENNTIGVLAVYRDITERKLMERQSIQAEKFAVLGQIAAGLAHEIRNPLTTVKGFLQMFHPSDSRYSEYVDLMLDEVNRTNKLVGDFILLANPQAPVFKPRLLNEILQVICNSHLDRLTKQGIVLEYYPSTLPHTYLDKEQIEHLLTCLIDNAIEAMPCGGTLGIRTKTLKSRLQVEIWDTGSGIAPETLDRVFDPFFTTKETGIGLGLSIVYHIISSHHGSITLNSNFGFGTTVTIELPYDHLSDNRVIISTAS